jgi:D-alanyl-D-alanine carboxypeptidase/D-alanyl-D-alanine-endopeptidase (penicillin-binding protein 4)
VVRPLRAALVTIVGCAVGASFVASAGGAQAVRGPSLGSSGADAAPVVLAPAKTEGVTPTAAGVRRVLGPILEDPALGRHNGAYVYDASRNKVVFSTGTAKPYAPASTLKLLTTTAALATLGPDHWFTTKTVSLGGGNIVLVGGGDPLLMAKRSAGPQIVPQRATLQDLAAQTARELRAQGIRSVKLGYDATLFTGPAENAKWLPAYVAEGIASRTSALWVDEGRLKPGTEKRATSPSLAAASAFAGQLRAAGLTVSGPRAMEAPSTATTVARVRSAPLGEIVEHVNLHSDNDGAEVLLRHIGLATDSGGSYAGGLKGVRVALTGLGLKLGDARLEDGSGLSRTNRVPLDLLAGVVRVAASGDEPELSHLLTSLPVAGFSGSLEDRFAGPGTATGAGLVRAKTGTLTGIHSLAGFVRDRTGTVLVFALATDSAPPNKPLEARAALDRAASALAGCGCGAASG